MRVHCKRLFFSRFGSTVCKRVCVHLLSKDAKYTITVSTIYLWRDVVERQKCHKQMDYTIAMRNCRCASVNYVCVSVCVSVCVYALKKVIQIYTYIFLHAWMKCVISVAQSLTHLYKKKIYSYWIEPCVKKNPLKKQLHIKWNCPVGWGCRIHRLHLCRGVRPPHTPNECPR